ncbi:MAG: ribokinase [Acidisphaera sp.]|nr:ribokinase [Acidisphaera sp.]
MIIVFGSINLDMIFPVPALPAPGETVLTPEGRFEPGGKGANQAVAAALDGASVALAGAVGADPLAAMAVTGLQRAGVDLSRVEEVWGRTGTAAISVDRAGRNHVVVASGANLLARAEQVEAAVLRPDNTLVLQLETDAGETAALILRARAGGARIILNLAPAGVLPPEALRALDVLVVNQEEAAWLGSHLGTGVNAASLHQALDVGVVCTKGSEGVEAAAGDVQLRLPAHPVRAVDTTAAGDCFVGVLAAGLDRGLTLEAAARRANVAAGLCCTRRGTQGSLPTAAEIDAES